MTDTDHTELARCIDGQLSMIRHQLSTMAGSLERSLGRIGGAIT